MTEPDSSPDLAEPTDVSVDPAEVEQQAEQDNDGGTPTSSASRYEDGDAKGGTGGLDAGGAG